MTGIVRGSSQENTPNERKECPSEETMRSQSIWGDGNHDYYFDGSTDRTEWAVGPINLWIFESIISDFFNSIKN